MFGFHRRLTRSRYFQVFDEVEQRDCDYRAEKWIGGAWDNHRYVTAYHARLICLLAFRCRHADEHAFKNGQDDDAKP